jgi:hypothetical protein
MTLPWKSKTEVPEHSTLALIVINGKIAADVFTFCARRQAFIIPTITNKKIVDMAVKIAEIEGWLPLADIPLPAGVTKR